MYIVRNGIKVLHFSFLIAYLYIVILSIVYVLYLLLDCIILYIYSLFFCYRLIFYFIALIMSVLYLHWKLLSQRQIPFVCNILGNKVYSDSDTDTD